MPGPGENAGEIEDSNVRERARQAGAIGTADYIGSTETGAVCAMAYNPPVFFARSGE